MSIDAIRSDFALLDDWEDRYRYVIELGRALPPLPEALRTDGNKGARLCQSGLAGERGASRRPGQGPRSRLPGRQRCPYRARLDCHSVCAFYRDRTPEEILRTNALGGLQRAGPGRAFDATTLKRLFSMVERIRGDAAALCNRPERLLTAPSPSRAASVGASSEGRHNPGAPAQQARHN